MAVILVCPGNGLIRIVWSRQSSAAAESPGF